MSDQNLKGSAKDSKPQKETKEGKEGGFPKSTKPKFNFNFYWIYGIIIVAIIGTQFMNWGGGERKTTRDYFLNTMLKEGDVEKIVVKNDVLLSNNPPEQDPPPKDAPPA